MLIARQMEAAMRASAEEYPVLTVVGPRQSGKTTLVRTLFPSKPYQTLETPSTRLRAESDPQGFLASFPDGAILDEVQRVPSLLSYIQGIVDEKNRNGLFVLTGSANLLLMQNVSQSLAGRCAVFTLLPFSLAEAAGVLPSDSPLSAILCGGYPRLLVRGMGRPRFFANYIDTYVERDIRQLLNIKNTLLFSRFLRLLSGRVGSLLDRTSLANDCGISTKTVAEWFSVLQASSICFLLPPWHDNRGKRLVKTPKIYFHDTGLACALAGIETERQLERDPLRGGLFENLIVLEALKRALNAGRKPDLYFYRDANGVEIDLVEQRAGCLHPVEIKSSATFHPDFCKSLFTFAARHPGRCDSPSLVYGGRERFIHKGVSVLPFANAFPPLSEAPDA